jgi:hypothetical protein
MSIDKTGVKYRVSNVLAWGGPLGLSWGGWYASGGDRIVNSGSGLQIVGWEEPFFIGLAVYLACTTINYIIVGSLRLLPWRDIE